MLGTGTTTHAVQVTQRTQTKKYAVMQSTAGYYGHVAIEKVYNSGSIKISEYNYNVPLGYGTRIISKSSARHYNYIY